MLILILLVSLGSCLACSFSNRNRRIYSELTPESKILVYPDQISIKDGWLSGKGHIGRQTVLLAGKVKKQQIAKGRSFYLTNIKGEIRPIDGATNYGEFDYQQYSRDKNIYQRVSFKEAEFIYSKQSWIDKLHQIRYYLQQYFAKMPALLGFFTSELFLAENPSRDTRQILNNYRDLGVIHLLSISGLHVGIYTLIINLICYKLKLTEEEAFVCCLLILLVEIFLSAGQAGFIRASLTYVLGKITKWHGWMFSKLDLLGLTCILHLLLVPKLFLGVGAILSYVLMLGLILTEKLSQFKQSLFLNLLLTPFLLYFFFQINFLTVTFNWIVVPYFNFIVMPIVFVNLFVYAINPAWSLYFEKVLRIFEYEIYEIAQKHWGLITFGKINWWQCIILFLVTIVLILYCSQPKCNLKIKNSLKLGLIAGYIAYFVGIHFPLSGQVTFIDVGQGDSILITTPVFRKVYLIDTGGKLNFSNKKIDPQLNRITIPFLKAKGIGKIDGVFVTHQDADHVGDLRELLKQIKVEKLYCAKGLLENKSFKKRIDGVVRNTDIIELLAGMQVNTGKINFEVVYPYVEGQGKNEDSLSLTFVLAKKRWLFTGDLDQAGEKEIIKHQAFKVDYFKLGHHGSKTSSNPEFLQAIAPRMVFISAGRNNRFGHPHQETLLTLSQQRIPWVSTQECGMISWYYNDFDQTKFEFFNRGKK